MMEFFTVLMIKHFIVDLGMQQYLGPRAKHKWLGDGHTHYLHHGITTMFVALWFAPQIAVVLGLLDYVIHWHIDWGKHHLNRFLKCEARSVTWWWTNVLDQCLHVLTYYLLVACSAAVIV